MSRKFGDAERAKKIFNALLVLCCLDIISVVKASAQNANQLDARQQRANCPNATNGHAGNIYICCPVILYAERLPPGTIICPQPGQNQPVDLPALTPDQVKDRLYITAMSHINRQMIARGRLAGQSFRSAYSDAALPKATAMCINWRNTNPYQINIEGRNTWQFITGQGTCAPRNEAEARQCALNECRQHANCDSDQSCTLIDLNGRNVLSPPADWLQTHARQ